MASPFQIFRCWFCILSLLMGAGLSGGAKPFPLHTQVLVFIPAYEGSQLIDPDLDKKREEPACVWGSPAVFFSSKLYFSLRMPNPLVAKPMLAVGPIDVYGKFVATVTHRQAYIPGFRPYTEGADFFVFAYDWRQEIATATAPRLGDALENYARIHESKTGIPASQTEFIIVTHSMGGLVARTLLSAKPEWANRVARLYLVGSPNTGCVKAIKTTVFGSDSLKSSPKDFPGLFLSLLPTNVDQEVTKLVAITRPSLYELLPFDDPHWKREIDGNAQRMRAQDVLDATSWETYWPSAELERKLFLNQWLKDRQKEGWKQIEEPEWEYCQDPGFEKLKRMLSQTARWRRKMGRLSHTNNLLTRSGEASRLKVILSAGLPTPSEVVTNGSHDASSADYKYEPAGSGDGTVEERRVLDDLPSTFPNIERLHGVPHGKLMVDPHFLAYFTKELSDQTTMSNGK
jgi:hypothetical protein